MKTRTWIAAAALILLTTPAALEAATWQIDGAHSTVGFTIKHLGISKVYGQFTDFEGILEFDEADMSKGSVEVAIHTTSIDTRNEDRDNHLRAADFFDVENNPEIRFESAKVMKHDEGWVLHGTLTIKGVSKKVEIPFEFIGSANDPWGGTRAGFEGSLTIEREDFGVGWSNAKYRPPLIGNDVEITLNLEVVQKKES